MMQSMKRALAEALRDPAGRPVDGTAQNNALTALMELWPIPDDAEA